MITGIQLGRAIAALAVVAYHANGYILPVRIYDGEKSFRFYDMGYLGVDFFFVLSGFIIYYIHYKDIGRSLSPKDFLIKRAVRIYPLYWVIFATLLMLYFAVPERGPSHARDPFYIITGILIWPVDKFPIIQVAWTLEHELLFYALFSILIAGRRVGILVLTVWFLLCASSLFIVRTEFPQNFVFHGKNLQFLCGMVAAHCYMKYRVAGRTCLYSGLVVFCGWSWLVAAGNLDTEAEINIIVFGVSGAFIVVGLTRLKVSRIWVLLGDASYAVYLIHLPAMAFLWIVLKRVDVSFISPHLMMLALIAWSAGAGIAAHLLVEKPLLKWIRAKFLKQHNTSVVA